MLGGIVLDVLAALTGRKLPISAVRVRKFSSETCFRSSRISATAFAPPVSLAEGLSRTVRFEFAESHDEGLFYSE
jgi:hypothetical protein